MSDIQTLQLQLRRRQAELEAKAASNKLALGSGKMLGLGGLGSMAWMLVIGNPAAAAIIGGIAFVNYVAAAGAEAKSTGEFRPLLGRKNFTNLMMGLDKEAMSVEPLAAVEDDALYLNDRDLGEWILLHTSRPKCAEYLQQFPPEQRDEVVNLLSEEAYRGYGYLFRSSPDSRMQMRAEGVGQYAFAAVEDEAKFLRELSAEPSPALPPSQPQQPTIGNQTRLTAVEAPVVQPVARAVEPVLLPEPDEGFDWQPEVVKGGASTPLAPKPPSWDDDADLSNTTRYDWMDDLLSYPSVLIYGAPGAGKSTFAEWLVIKRKDAGHQLEILDPHRAYGQWKGLDVFGDGMDFLSIDDRLKAFADLVESRYLKRSQKPDFNPRPMTVLAEEFTQWAKKCEHSAAFFEMSVSDIRKISMHVIYVSHARTMTALGGSKGLAGTRDSALLELELLAKVDEATGKATPAMRGLLKYPGRAPIEVAIPNLDKPTKTTKPPCATENQLQTLAQAGDLSTLESIKKTLEERVAMGRLKGR
jgi:hypothetical protein